MKQNWEARIAMMRHLVEAENHAIALGFCGAAQDLRILINRFIRTWDDEFGKEA